MSNRYILAIILIVTLLNTSCSRSQSGGASAAPEAPPTNKQEALAQLTPSQRLAFEAWEGQIVKSCDAGEAFGLKSERDLRLQGIDSSALLEQNDDSFFFTDGDQSLIINGYTSFSGIDNIRVEENLQINGQTQSISVESRREGSRCSVYLFDQLVFEGHIAESFTIAHMWASSKRVTPIASQPQINPISGTGMGELIDNGPYQLINELLQPTEQAFDFLAKTLNISTEQARRSFKINPVNSSPVSVRVEDIDASVWNSPFSRSIIAKEAHLREIFLENTQPLALELRLAHPQNTFSDNSNNKNVGNIKLLLKIALSSSTDGMIIYSLDSIHMDGVVEFDKTEALTCAADRAEVLLAQERPPNQIRPSVVEVFSPCTNLYPDIKEASFESGLMQSLILDLFDGVTPSAQFQYGQWMDVLERLALQVLNQNQSIRDELDPTGRTIIIPLIAEHLEPMKDALTTASFLRPYREFLYSMGLTWSFNGQKVHSARINEIIASINNSMSVYTVSSQRLLADLRRRPESSNDQLQFARSLNEKHKTEGQQALALARKLDFGDFEKEVFNQVLQNQTTIEQLQQWSSTFSVLDPMISKYPSINPVKGDLVRLSLRWLQTGEASSTELDLVYSAISNVIASFRDSTNQLIRDLGQSLSRNQAALAFARSLSEEYKGLASDMLKNSALVGFEDWGRSLYRTILQQQPQLNQLRAWSTTWTAARGFTEREKTRTQNELASINEINRKSVIEVAIQETWTDREFKGLEQIAELARQKSSCERHRGSSSLAQCAGLGLFSVKTGKFFDPFFNQRYVGLSKYFRAHTLSLSAFEWSSLRRQMVQGFFNSSGPIWSACTQSAFQQKASTLNDLIQSIQRETDQSRKWELERQIRDVLRNC